MSDEAVLAILTDIRNWTRAASYQSVKTLLESALPDAKSRKAYQMFDGGPSLEQVRIACKMSPTTLTELAQKWASMGLMEVQRDKKRLKLFDLKDFGLIDGQ